MKPQIVKIEEFKCPNLSDIFFQFPVFKEWETKAISPGKEGCTLFLNWPETICYETARLIAISKHRYPGNRPDFLKAQDFQIGKIKCFAFATNTQGVTFSFTFDPDRYVPGYQPPKGWWDYLFFYSSDFYIKVRIEGGSEDHGFSVQQFSDMITGTFRFINSPFI